MNRYTTRLAQRSSWLPSLVLLSLVLPLAALTSCTEAPPAPGSSHPAADTSEHVNEQVHPGANATFEAEDLDVDRFVAIFEGESREISVHRDAVVAVLGVEAGARVADIGAGTGLFLPALDRAVGDKGRVFAVDVSPKFLAHLNERVHAEGLERVEVVRGGDKAVGLRHGSVDIAFVCDTYHHFEYPESILASLRDAIRPGGTLVVVDFERIPGKTRAFLLEHMRADKQTFTREIAAAGFELLEEVDVEGLEENYVLRFRRP